MDDSQQVLQSNLDVLQSELSARYFDGMSFLMNAKLFAVPQNKRRHFAVYVASGDGIVDFDGCTVFDLLKTMSECLKICRRALPPTKDVLLPSDDQFV